MTTEADKDATIRVDVVFALPERYWTVRLELASGSTVSEALSAARLPSLDERIEIDPARLAIFSRLVSISTVLRDGDRLEVLRPLTADPKQSRRARALEPRLPKR
ncbi:MAG: RnfH family protein [Arenimonas sp.]